MAASRMDRCGVISRPGIRPSSAGAIQLISLAKPAASANGSGPSPASVWPATLGTSQSSGVPSNIVNAMPKPAASATRQGSLPSKPGSTYRTQTSNRPQRGSLRTCEEVMMKVRMPGDRICSQKGTGARSPTRLPGGISRRNNRAIRAATHMRCLAGPSGGPLWGPGRKPDCAGRQASPDERVWRCSDLRRQRRQGRSQVCRRAAQLLRANF